MSEKITLNWEGPTPLKEFVKYKKYAGISGLYIWVEDKEGAPKETEISYIGKNVDLGWRLFEHFLGQISGGYGLNKNYIDKLRRWGITEHEPYIKKSEQTLGIYSDKEKYLALVHDAYTNMEKINIYVAKCHKGHLNEIERELICSIYSRSNIRGINAKSNDKVTLTHDYTNTETIPKLKDIIDKAEDIKRRKREKP
jgi:hypothetical protein